MTKVKWTTNANSSPMSYLIQKSRFSMIQRSFASAEMHAVSEYCTFIYLMHDTFLG